MNQQAKGASVDELEALRKFVNQVSAAQAEALSTIRTNSFTFRTDLRRNDLSGPERWEKLAFTLYTRLVDLSQKAEQVLAEEWENETPVTNQRLVDGARIIVEQRAELIRLREVEAAAREVVRLNHEFTSDAEMVVAIGVLEDSLKEQDRTIAKLRAALELFVTPDSGCWCVAWRVDRCRFCIGREALKHLATPEA